MAKANLLYVGTTDGIVLFSDPGAGGRWLRVGHELRRPAAPPPTTTALMNAGVIWAVWTQADNPLIVVAAKDDGLHRSEDGGRTWSVALPTSRVTALVSHRSAPATVYAATPDGAVHRSADGGATWAQVADDAWQSDFDKRQPHEQRGPRAGRLQAGAVQLLSAHADPQKLYAVLTSGLTMAICQMFTSDNGGVDWREHGPAMFSSAISMEVFTCQIAESTARPGVIYAASPSALYRLEEQSAWEEVAGVEPRAALACLPGRDEALLLAVGNGDGIARTADSGATWATSSVDQPWSGDISLLAPSGYHIDTAFAGTERGQIAISTDRGATWRVLRGDLPGVRCVAAARLD